MLYKLLLTEARAALHTRYGWTYGYFDRGTVTGNLCDAAEAAGLDLLALGLIRVYSNWRYDAPAADDLAAAMGWFAALGHLLAEAGDDVIAPA